MKINETPEVSKKLVENTLAMKAMWENNDALHEGLNKSSKLIYKERHLDGDMIAPTKPLFNFDEKIMARAKQGSASVPKVAIPTGNAANTMASVADSFGKSVDATAFGSWNIKNTATNAMDSTKNLISEATTYTKSLLNKPLNKKIALASVAVLGLGAGLTYLFKADKNDAKHASTYIA